MMDQLQLPDKLKNEFKDLFTQATGKFADFKKQLDNGIVDARGLKKLESTGREITRIFETINKKTQQIGEGNLPTLYSGDLTKLQQAQQALQKAQEDYNNMATAAGAYRTQADAVIKLLNDQKAALGSNAKSWQELIDAINAGKFENFEKFLNYLKRTNLKENATELNNIEAAVRALGATGQSYVDNVNNAESAVNSFNISSKEQGDLLAFIYSTAQQAAAGMRQYTGAEVDAASAAFDASRAIDQISNKIGQLLSYGSGIALLRRSVRNAYNTIKELDAAMTETATVTDYSVSQMWQKLDDYTNIANQLGATTLGTYKTITLFFQQGLNEQQSLALATETMKMARVAGIDYAEATQYMTSALRGFNMELNETSATRVNDVYSELAKITAADTNQIAVAMSKVASLANSANMELETTSAFLSQIIETTQEAPETAGTALKTIIARFSEVKKLFNEGDITGTDEGGDVIDVNKIGAALKNIGIDLNQYIAGNVGLDEIFIQLAEKWDNLSLVQQRYIATQAAGSRQQSRFIAMMQNYSRTMELVDAAYNSAGSGQEQFEKTLESLEAKLNNLHNAWSSFSMSIANSDIIKSAVDLFTDLLTTINNLTDAFGPLSGAIKIFLGFGLFKTGNTLLGGKTGPLATLFSVLKSDKDLFKALNAAMVPLGNNFKTLGTTITNFLNPVWGLENQIASLQKQHVDIQEQIKNVPKGSEQAAELQKQLDGLDASITRLSTDAAKSAAKTRALGNSLTIVGGAVIALGAALKNKGLKEDNEELQKIGAIISYIGAGAVGIGQLISLLPQLTTALNITTAAAAGLLGVVGLFAAAIGAAIASIVKYHQHTKDLYGSSTKLAEKITTVYDSLNNVISLTDGLQELTKGSIDWYIQLDKIKKILDEIYSNDPEMRNFLTFNEETGEITFDQKGYEAHVKQLREQRDRADQIKQLHDTQTRSSMPDDADPQMLAYARDVGLAKSAYDINKIAELYELGGKVTEDQLKSYIEYAQTAQKTWDVERQREYIAQQTGNTDIRDDELADYFIETFLNASLEALKEALNPSNSASWIQDKKGQNIEQQNQDLTYRELADKYDAAIVEDEDAQALYTYWQTLENLPPILEKNKNLLRELALDSGQASRNFGEFAKAIKDNKDNLTSLDKSTVDYQKSLGAVANASGKAFGIQLDSSFIEEHLEDFISAFVDGVPEALDSIREDLLVEITPTLNQEDVPYIEGLLDYLSQDRSFQLTGVADLTSLFSAVNSGMTFTEEQLTRLNKQIQALGFELAIDTVKLDDGTYKVTGVVLQDSGKAAARNYGGSGKKSGGGSSKKEKAWENPYDQLYNLTERNEEAIRKRNILEKEYNAILRDRESAANELTKNSLQQLANLQEQLAYQKQLQAGRLKQINAVSNETWTDSEGNRKSYAAWDVTQYASYNQKTNAIEIDWDAIDKITDETKGKAIEDYVKRLEELQKEFEKTDEDILDIEAEIDEINRRSKDDFLSLEQRVYDAIVKQHQEVIDAYSSLNDTLNDTNDKIMNSLREQIDLERQIRDNTKTEEDIAEKEARLAYLQRDTSGANATETLRLQKEIDDARQSYSDSLIDQQIDSIEKGNEKAAEQRQIQISMMQEQLDYWTKNGAFWSTVSSLLTNAIDPETGKLDKNNAALVSLLMSADNFGGLSEFGQMDWYDDLVEAFNKGMEGFGNFKMQQAEEAGEITQSGNTYKYDKSKKAWMLDGEAYTAMYDPVTKQYIFTRTKDLDVKVGEIGGEKDEIKADNSGDTPGKRGKGEDVESEIPSAASRLKDYVVTYEDWSTVVTAASEQAAKIRAVIRYKKDKNLGDNFPQQTWMKYATVSLAPLRYAEGGMVNFTGPAWLDGTKTKPEAVLNAKQTELFIELRDMLEKFGQTGGFTNSYGNTYVDLDVNADIGSDYDVDSLVNRLKRDILDSSSYRNVNMLSRGH